MSLRIVAGRLSGRRLGAVGPGVRPTSERVREAIGSILQARHALEDAEVLDLFAGTGALSFEALSRGAARATLVERDRRTARQIERSAAALGLAEFARVVVCDLSRKGFSKSLGTGEKATLAFLDPPYRDAAHVGPILTELLETDRLAAGAKIVIEHSPRNPPPIPGGFAALASYRYGDTALSLIEPT